MTDNNSNDNNNNNKNNNNIFSSSMGDPSRGGPYPISPEGEDKGHRAAFRSGPGRRTGKTAGSLGRRGDGLKSQDAE